MEQKKRKAVVLLSGGLDSTTTLAMALRYGFEVYALTLRYGQRHEVEVMAAERVATSFNVARHITIDVDLRRFGGSALTDNIAVPKGREFVEIAHDIPATYVPARNTIFLSFAVAWAETIGARNIFIGVNSLDYSGYPDCRPQFIEAFAKCANLGTKATDEGWKFKINAPLQKLTKSEIIRLGTELGVDYSLTHSCYDPDAKGHACGKCDSCRLREKGFKEAGIKDPL